MAFVEDPGRVAETTTTAGAGAVAVLGAVATYQRFNLKMSVGDTFPGGVVASDGQWMEGIWTYSATNQVTFTTVLDGSSGTSPITLPAGTHTVFAGFLGMGKTIANAPVHTAPAAGDKLAILDSATGLLKSVSLSALHGGSGGTSTTALTLTSTSAVAQRLAFTLPGVPVILPDATTMAAVGSTVFDLFNAGSYHLPVQDSTGVIRGFIQPQGGASVSLIDKSTAAGVWTLRGNTNLMGTTALYQNLSISCGYGELQVVTLDADRDMLVFGATACYAIVYNRTTRTWGSATLVRSGLASSGWAAIKCATDKVLIASAITTAMEAVVLSTSGTTITVNSGSKATATLAGAINSFSGVGSGVSRPVALTGSFVFGYSRATTTTALRAITVSTNTPTIGAESVLSAASANVPLLYASGTTVIAISKEGATPTGVVRPYVNGSGTTLTAGTTQAFATNIFSGPRVLPFGARWLVLWAEAAGSHAVGASLVTVTAGNASISTLAGVLSASTGSIPALLCNGKVVVGTVDTTSNFDRFNVLTDTSGTLSAGTALDVPSSSMSTSDIADIWSVGTDAVFLTHSASSGGGEQYFISAAASSPAVSAWTSFPGSSGGNQRISTPSVSSNDGNASYERLTSTAGVVKPANSGGYINDCMVCGSANLFVSHETDLFPCDYMDAPPGVTTRVWKSWEDGDQTAPSGIMLTLLEAAQP